MKSNRSRPNNLVAEMLEPRRLLAVVSQGTANQVSLLTVLPVVPDHLVHIDGVFYFAATTPEHGNELWRSDGTPTGTFMVRDINPGPAQAIPSYFGIGQPPLVVMGDQLFFRANDGVHGFELWKSDGTAAGTQLVRDIRPGANSGLLNTPTLAPLDGRLYFSAEDGIHRREVWVSDGTEQGTMLRVDLPAASDLNGPGDFFSLQGSVFFFTATVNSNNPGGGLWRIDDTASGASIVSPFGNRTLLAAELGQQPTRLGDAVLFIRYHQGTRQLWRTDGTGVGTSVLADIGAALGGADYLPPIGASAGRVFFAGHTPETGYELWQSDGTPGGTALLRDINPGAASSLFSSGRGRRFVDLDGTLIFNANDGISGSELWRTNGTSDGTALTVDREPGSASIPALSLTRFGDAVYFGGDCGIGRTDGSAQRTVLMPSYLDGSLIYFTRDPLVVNDEMYFIANRNGGAALMKIAPGDTTPPLVESSIEAYGGRPPAIEIRFSEHVGDSFDLANFVVTDLDTGAKVPPAQLEVMDADPKYSIRARLTYPGFPSAVLPDGNYRVSLAAGAIEDAFGNPMQSSFSKDFFFFTGDANHDRVIDINDYVRLGFYFNKATIYSNGDFDRSGIVDLNDFAILASKFNTTLPAPRPSPLNAGVESGQLSATSSRPISPPLEPDGVIQLLVEPD